MQRKGKKRADACSLRMYDKDFESLQNPVSKILVLATALEEAESEIESLKNELSELKKID